MWVWLSVDGEVSASTRWSATRGVRSYVTRSARGRQHRGREVSLGGAVDRGIRQERAIPLLRRCPGLRPWGNRQEVVTTPKLEGRRQATLHSRHRGRLRPAAGRALTGRPQGWKEASSRIDHSAGCSCRGSVAEVGETHLPRCPPSGRSQDQSSGERGVARGDHPAFDEAGQDRSKRQGCGAGLCACKSKRSHVRSGRKIRCRSDRRRSGPNEVTPLNKRSSGLAWRGGRASVESSQGGAKGARFRGEERSPRFGSRRATWSVRGPNAR